MMTEETTPTEASVMNDKPSADSKFQELLNKTMTRRWNITAIVLTTFLFIAVGIALAVNGATALDQEWKEILLLFVLLQLALQL